MAKQDVAGTPAGRARSVVSSLLSLRDERHAGGGAAPPSDPPSSTKQRPGSLLGRVMGAAAEAAAVAGAGYSAEEENVAPAAAPGGRWCHSSLINRPRTAPEDEPAVPSKDEQQPQQQQQPLQAPPFSATMTDEAKSYGVYAYGDSFLEEGDFSRALSCYNRALILQRSSLGVNHEMTGRTLRAIGTCLMKMGGENSFAALTALEEALYIRQIQYGEGDPGAAEITNDIWTLLHKKRLELKGTPDREGMLKGMKRQKSKKELQSFIFQSVRRRGSLGMWSSDSVRNLRPCPSEASDSTRSEMTESSVESDAAVCPPRKQSSSPSSSSSRPPPVQLSSVIAAEDSPSSPVASSPLLSGAETYEIDLNDARDNNDSNGNGNEAGGGGELVSLPTTPASARRRRRNSLIGAAPAMGQIREDSMGSMDLEADLERLELSEHGNRSGAAAADDDNDNGPRPSDQGDQEDDDPYQDGGAKETRQCDGAGNGDDDGAPPSAPGLYSGVSFRNIGDLGGRWAQQADESYDALQCYGALREEAAQKARAQQLRQRQQQHKEHDAVTAARSAMPTQHDSAWEGGKAA